MNAIPFSRPRQLAAVLGTLAVAAALVGPGQAAGDMSSRSQQAADTAKATPTVVVSTRKVDGLGTVLVDKKGLTLYMFVPDKRKRVTCVSTCAALWPPVFLPKGGKALAKGKTEAKLLGSDPDPAGGRVVTYHGWPLYTYVADTKPGMATGQALNLNGGLWYVLSPAGKVIHTKPPL
jgi:predicted lipoprotein with Yx(FWY)xxD motif